jgi:hypothetical protein
MKNMEQETKERIENYCQMFEEIHKKVSRMNPEDAKEVALKILEEIAKDLRSEQINRSRGMANKAGEEKGSKENLVTQKQREALHRFGIKNVPGNLSMREASSILNRLISLSRTNDRTSIDKAVEELNRDWA